MNIRIPTLKIQNLVKDLQDFQDFFSELPVLNYRFCPFTIILGEIESTESGYRTAYSVPNDYSAFSKVFNGNNAVIAVWDNSYTLQQNNPTLPDIPTDNDLDNYFGTKLFKVGDYFEGYLESDSLGLDFTPSPGNENLTQEQIVKSVDIIVPNNTRNASFINKITENVFKLYVIPKLNNEQISNINDKNNPFNDVDKQWFYLQNVIKVWNKSEKIVGYVKLSFVSLNDKLSNTGTAINQYVQTGGPGEPYAFPSLDNEDDIKLDFQRLTPLPITHAQITLYGTSAFSNIAFMGRPVNIYENDNDFKIEASRLLFPYKYQAAIYDQISFKSIPQNNYYVCPTTYTIDTYYKNWRDEIAAKQLFDETNQKVFEGHLRIRKGDLSDLSKKGALYSNVPVIENQPNANGLHFNYWSSSFLTSTHSSLDDTFPDDVPPNFNISLSWLYNYENNITGKTIKSFTNDTLNFLAVTSQSLAQFNMLNYSIFYTVYQVPLDIRQTTPITLSELPIIGGFLNKMTLGIPVGFKTSEDVPQNIQFPLLINCAIFNYGANILYDENNTQDDAIIPFNILDNSNDRIPALLGANTQTTAFCFNLTDRIVLDLYNESGLVQGQTANTTTRELGQYRKINDSVEGVRLLGNNANLQPSRAFGYIIDSVSFQQLGKCDYSLAFFSRPSNFDSPVDWNHCVWFGKYQTFSKITGNTRLWTEFKQLSNPLFSFSEIFNYPKDIQFPKGAVTITRNNIEIETNLNYNFPNLAYNNLPPNPDDPKTYNVYSTSILDFSQSNNSVTKALFLSNAYGVFTLTSDEFIEGSYTQTQANDLPTNENTITTKSDERDIVLNAVDGHVPKFVDIQIDLVIDGQNNPDLNAYSSIKDIWNNPPSGFMPNQTLLVPGSYQHGGTGSQDSRTYPATQKVNIPTITLKNFFKRSIALSETSFSQTIETSNIDIPITSNLSYTFSNNLPIYNNGSLNYQISINKQDFTITYNSATRTLTLPNTITLGMVPNRPSGSVASNIIYSSVNGRFPYGTGNKYIPLALLLNNTNLQVKLLISNFVIHYEAGTLLQKKLKRKKKRKKFIIQTQKVKKYVISKFRKKK